MKNILLAVTGISPQVITETLYALHQSDRKIDSIHVITTRDGKENIYSSGNKAKHNFKKMYPYTGGKAGLSSPG
ncbi:MAG: hypothetical protein GY797_16460 [Deltaproteobacteria bacterium]|nr:hypothetical protein [Deltaproteobacteria bacterium]